MWARFRTIKIKKDNQVKSCKISVNVNEEYRGALRTKSYADFFTKAQLFVQEPLMSSPSFCHHKFAEVLLEPGQETITAFLESTSMSKDLDIRGLILNYFEVSAEASKICTELLKSIIKIQSNYELFQQTLDIMEDFPPSRKLDCNLYALMIHNNPFSSLNKQDFEMIHDRYSSTLENLKTKRKKVARKMKMISCFNKASGICVTAACGLVAIAAMALAAHTLTALVMGPMLLTSLPLKPLKKKLINLKFLKSKFLRRVGEQLDVAMKGTYILNRDFDMMSRLVSRLQDDIERRRRMVEVCLKSGQTTREEKICLQVLRELKKNDVLFRKQVEELEEHVYLCLLTINKARALVIKELSRSCGDQHQKS